MPTFLSSDCIVDTPSGCLKGQQQADGIRSWKGIPYAAPVSETGRFLAAQPHPEWLGVRDALAYGPIAPQGAAAGDGPAPIMDEDCHVLNIWSPAMADALPVMVWIHGGAYMAGAGSEPAYDGSMLAARGDVVVVTFNYRLGYLGFLDLSALPGADGRFETNLGLRDQVRALQWVRDHIAAFGGDPARVTVFGESAGGGSVACLLACPHAQGLFQAAILQSPPARSVHSRAQAAKVTQAYLRLLGRPAATFDDFMRLPSDALVEQGRVLAAEVAERFPSHHAFQPVVDGEWLPDLPETTLADGVSGGVSGGVPVLIGSNEDEGSLFARPPLPPIIPAVEPHTQHFLQVNFPTRAAAIRQAYEGHGRFGADVAIGGDGMILVPVTRLAEVLSAQGPVYVYRLRWTHAALMAKRLGSPHGLDLSFVFGQFTTGMPEAPTGDDEDGVLALRDEMQTAWLSFAHIQRPTADEAAWPAYDTARRAVMCLDRASQVEYDVDRRQRLAWLGGDA